MKIVTTTVTTVTKQIERPITGESNIEFAWLNGKCLESAAYNHRLEQLFLTFGASGNVYRYFNVPASEF